jgi:anti-repressor protein
MNEQNSLQVFDFEDRQVRIVMVDGEPWWVVTDVCEILDLSNPTTAIERLDEDERSKFNLGRQGEVNLVNEAGLYSLILGSRKPEAKAFKRWIVHDIIPSIRKHGAYMTPQKAEEILLNPDTIIRLAQQIKDSQEKIRNLTAKVEADHPKVLFADSVSASETSILIGDLAKLIRQNGYDIGQKRLFEWLRGNGFLMKSGNSKNMPTQRALDMKLFEVLERAIDNPDGSIRITRTTKVTGKGQVYFVNQFLGDSPRAA